jgi:hypothetical protein
MQFIVEQSQPGLNKEEARELELEGEGAPMTTYDKLLTTNVHLSPVQLFHLRFN